MHVSSPPDNANLPSGEIATAPTAPTCPFQRRSSLPVSTSQSRTVSSSAAETNRLPSGENARLFTSLSCPRYALTSLPVWRSHKMMTLSLPAPGLSGRRATWPRARSVLNDPRAGAAPCPSQNPRHGRTGPPLPGLDVDPRRGRRHSSSPAPPSIRKDWPVSTSQTPEYCRRCKRGACRSSADRTARTNYCGMSLESPQLPGLFRGPRAAPFRLCPRTGPGWPSRESPALRHLPDGHGESATVCPCRFPIGALSHPHCKIKPCGRPERRPPPRPHPCGPRCGEQATPHGAQVLLANPGLRL